MARKSRTSTTGAASAYAEELAAANRLADAVDEIRRRPSGAGIRARRRELELARNAFAELLGVDYTDGQEIDLRAENFLADHAEGTQADHDLAVATGIDEEESAELTDEELAELGVEIPQEAAGAPQEAVPASTVASPSPEVRRLARAFVAAEDVLSAAPSGAGIRARRAAWQAARDEFCEAANLSPITPVEQLLATVRTIVWNEAAAQSDAREVLDAVLDEVEETRLYVIARGSNSRTHYVFGTSEFDLAEETLCGVPTNSLTVRRRGFSANCAECQNVADADAVRELLVRHGQADAVIPGQTSIDDVLANYAETGSTKPSYSGYADEMVESLAENLVVPAKGSRPARNYGTKAENDEARASRDRQEFDARPLDPQLADLVVRDASAVERIRAMETELLTARRNADRAHYREAIRAVVADLSRAVAVENDEAVSELAIELLGAVSRLGAVGSYRPARGRGEARRAVAYRASDAELDDLDVVARSLGSATPSDAVRLLVTERANLVRGAKR